MARRPPGEAEQPAEDEQHAELVEQLAALLEADRLQRAQSEPEDDVGCAHRHGEQKQRLEGLGGGAVAPHGPVSEHPLSEIAEQLTEQDAEHDRPHRSRHQDPADPRQERRAHAKGATGEERDASSTTP